MVILNFFKGILESFSNNKDGHSARKWTAFILTACVVYIHIRFVDISIAVEVLIIDLLFVALLLGLVTADNLIQLRMGRNQTPEPKKEDK